MKEKDTPKFEKLNPELNMNVFELNEFRGAPLRVHI